MVKEDSSINRAASPWRGDFAKLWSAQTISAVGSTLTREALPMAAVLTLGASPAAMGALSAVGGAAQLLFGLAAGLWVDRLRRRPVLIATDLGRALLLLSIPAAAVLGALTMAQLFVVMAAAGVLTVLFDVAYQSYLPSMVSREQLFEGNRRLAISSSVAEITGPGLAGVLVQSITAPFAILIDAVSFFLSAALIGSIRTEEAAPRAREPERVWVEALAGMRFIWNTPALRALAWRAGSVFLFFGMLGPQYELYAIRTLKMGPALVGLIVAVGGASALVGATLAGRVTRALGVGPTLLATSLGVGAGCLLIPLAHGGVALAASFLISQQLLGDACFTIYNVNEISLRQRLAPPEMLGRVNAGMQLITRGVWPFGALAGGWLAGIIGLRPMLAISAAGILLTALWLASPAVLKLENLVSEYD